VDISLSTILSLAPYVFGVLAVAIVAWPVARFLRRRKVITRDDLARFNSKFPLDYLARSLNDPTFNPHEFLDVVRQMFLDFHEGLANGSIDGLKGFISTELYEERMALVAARKARHQKTVLKKFKLHGLTISDATSIGGYDAVTVRFLASSSDYEIDAQGKRFGDRQVRAWEEDWIFERSTDAATKLREVWTLTAIHAVDRNRFRPDQIRVQNERQHRFRTGQSIR
jgi:hypothetical protein